MKGHDIYLFFWLLPCIFSFTLSCLIMGNVILTDGLRAQLFQQLAFLLALSDVIQTQATFYGDYGDFRNDDRDGYKKCCVQNYTLQFGTLFKTCILVFIGGVVWHIVRYLRSPKHQYAILSCSIIFPILLTLISIFFRTADVYCSENFEYSEESASGQTSYLMLLALFFAPLYLLLLTLVVCCVAVKIKLSKMQIGNPGVELVLRRLMLYPLVFLLSLIPATLLAIFQFVLGYSVLVLELLTGFFVSFSGFLFGCVYIRHQKKYPERVEHLLRLLGGCLLDGLGEGGGGRLEAPLLSAGSSFSAVTISGTGTGGTGTESGGSGWTSRSSVTAGGGSSLSHQSHLHSSHSVMTHSPFTFYKGTSKNTSENTSDGLNNSSSECSTDI
jgi:uncharacterized membrane protein YgcG